MNSYVDQPSSQRNQITNLRTYQRNIPSQPLQPYLDARPVLTKYSILPIIDYRKPVNTPLIQQPTYSLHQTFNPGNDTAPWSGYASNVNDESELRNQIFALQNCSQSVYIPSSKSSLYNVHWKKDNSVQQPFPDLFKKQQFNPVNPNAHPDKIGFALFNNATRQQIKDLTRQTKKL
jgi:hypothetical protein